jgi:hypothetical protein
MNYMNSIIRFLYTFVASSLAFVCSAIKFTQAHDLCNCSEQLVWSYGGAAGGGKGGWSGEPQVPFPIRWGLHVPLIIKWALANVGDFSWNFNYVFNTF